MIMLLYARLHRLIFREISFILDRIAPGDCRDCRPIHHVGLAWTGTESLYCPFSIFRESDWNRALFDGSVSSAGCNVSAANANALYDNGSSNCPEVAQ
jgi:hypothetical protein